MTKSLTLYGDPEHDPHPSVEDEPREDFCPWCEAMPHERHHPRCPMSDGTDVDDVQFCDGCGSSYVTNCDCDGDE